MQPDQPNEFDPSRMNPPSADKQGDFRGPEEETFQQGSNPSQEVQEESWPTGEENGPDGEETEDPRGEQDKPRAPDGESNKQGPVQKPDDLLKVLQVHGRFSDMEIGRDCNLGQQTINNIFAVSETFRRPEVTDFEQLSTALLFQLRSTMVFDPEALEPLVETLEDRRVLILAGDSESGKGTLARLVASQLLERFSASPLEGALLCRSIPREWRLDLTSLASSEKFCRRKAMIILDAFESRNRALSSFLQELTEGAETVASTLAKAGSFLILTTVSVPQFEESLRSRGILQSMPRPATADLMEGLRRLLHKVAETQGFSSSKMEAFLSEYGSEVIKELTTFPLLVRFVDQTFVKVLLKQLSLREALDRVKDLGRSVLVDQTGDFEVWCAAASLTLCTAASVPTPVPWLQFVEVWTALFRSVSRELETASAERSLERLSQTEEILQRIQAEDVAGSFPRPFGIRFRKETQRDRLWRSLLGSGRSLPGLLLPWLERVVSDRGSRLQEVAARALGRLGQLDPPGIAVGRIREAFETRESFVLGWLFQGVLASSDEGYRSGCARILKDLLETEISEKGSSQVAAAVASLALIAPVDGRLGVELLGRVIRSHLEVQWEVLRASNERIRSLKADYGASWTREQRVELEEVVGKLLRGQIVEDAVYPILVGVRFSLPLLFSWTENIEQFLTALVEWMDTGLSEQVEGTGSQPSGPLLSFILLHNWENVEFLKGEEGCQGMPGRRVLRDAAAMPGAKDALFRLTEKLYGHLQPFPGAFRSSLERGFELLLMRWAEYATQTDELEAVVVDLLRALFDSEERKLADFILRLAQTEHPSPKRRALCEMAHRAVTQS